MNNKVLRVFTFRGMDNILTYGGSCSWVINPKVASACKYILCTHNANSPYCNADPQDHGRGFLVGKISEIEPTPEKTDPEDIGVPPISSNRKIVRVSHYAEVDVERFWEQSRNPIGYFDEEGEKKLLEALGISTFDDLDFKPVPERDLNKIAEYNRAHTLQRQEYEFKGKKMPVTPTYSSGLQGLSIEEAKEGLALHFGISPQNIEIRITA